MSDLSQKIKDANTLVQTDVSGGVADSVEKFAQATTDWILKQDPATTPTPIPPTPTPTPKLMKYGVCPGASSHQWSDADHAWYTAAMRDLAQGKPFYVRVIAGDNAATNRDVDKFNAAGLTTMLVLYGTTGPTAPTAMPKTLAARYKGMKVIYEGINEPDINGWTANPLADFQKAMYGYVKEGDPNALCGSPGLWKGNPNGYAQWVTFPRALAARAKGYFDFFATHCGYDDPTITAASAASWNYYHWNFKKYGTVAAGGTTEEILAAAGINVPIMSSEGGGGGTEQNYLDKVTKILNSAKNGPLASCCVYTIEADVPGYQVLIRPDKSLTPAYNSFKQFMAGV